MLLVRVCLFVLLTNNEAPQYYGPVWEGHFKSNGRESSLRFAVAKVRLHILLLSDRLSTKKRGDSKATINLKEV